VEWHLSDDVGGGIGDDNFSQSVRLAIVPRSRAAVHRSRQEAAEGELRDEAPRNAAHPYRHDGRHGLLQHHRDIDHHHHGSYAAREGRHRHSVLVAGGGGPQAIAGAFAEIIFALGIIGTGLLAIPVLAGSPAYAIGEGRKWPVGLSRKPKQAAAFYSVLALSVGLGVILNFTPLDPIKALYWSAVINGILAAPVMVMLMLLVRNWKVMGDMVVRGWLYALGWASTVARAFCIVGMFVSLLLP
jgi:hypothetical protein